MVHLIKKFPDGVSLLASSLLPELNDVPKTTLIRNIKIDFLINFSLLVRHFFLQDSCQYINKKDI